MPAGKVEKANALRKRGPKWEIPAMSCSVLLVSLDVVSPEGARYHDGTGRAVFPGCDPSCGRNDRVR
jgi:hypothetical protein